MKKDQKVEAEDHIRKLAAIWKRKSEAAKD